VIAFGSAEHPPAAAGGDLAEFLDVDVHQVAGGSGLHPADDAAGGAVQPAQASHLVAAEHAVHRGHVESQQVGDAGWAPAAQHTDFDDASFRAGRGLVGAAMGPGAAVGHTGRPFFAVAPRPALGGGDGDLEPFGSSPQRPAVLDDATSQAQTTGFRQRSITVGHEDLRD
jgi:hypothetical protein